MPTAVSDPRMVALLTGARRVARTWPGLRVDTPGGRRSRGKR